MYESGSIIGEISDHLIRAYLYGVHLNVPDESRHTVGRFKSASCILSGEWAKNTFFLRFLQVSQPFEGPK